MTYTEHPFHTVWSIKVRLLELPTATTRSQETNQHAAQVQGSYLVRSFMLVIIRQ